jgi:hypothetical protein
MFRERCLCPGNEKFPLYEREIPAFEQEVPVYEREVPALL